MADYVTLLGAEDVRNAAHQIREAAQDMNRSVSYLDDVLTRHRMAMDDWLSRLEAALQSKGEK